MTAFSLSPVNPLEGQGGRRQADSGAEAGDLLAPHSVLASVGAGHSIFEHVIACLCGRHAPLYKRSLLHWARLGPWDVLEQVRVCLSWEECLSLTCLSVLRSPSPGGHSKVCLAGPRARVVEAWQYLQLLGVTGHIPHPLLHTLNLPSPFGTGGSGGLNSHSCCAIRSSVLCSVPPPVHSFRVPIAIVLPGPLGLLLNLTSTATSHPTEE